MKKQVFSIGFLAVLIAEIVALIVFAVQTHDFSQDAVAVNEVVRSVEEDFYALEKHKNTTALDYVVLDGNGDLLYKTKSGISESVNAAIAHRDTVLDITVDGIAVGKVIIYNDGAQTLLSQKRTVISKLKSLKLLI